jgi:caffeoyl-CoA O-methyltransferase
MKSLFAISILFILAIPLFSQTNIRSVDLDKKVRAYLDKTQSNRHEGNIPASDGKLFYDLIVKNGYTSALEIGTSTGYSTIWLAWALSKTGGKLITIEIDEARYKAALVNFKEAGLSDYIDARLADAHKLVYQLKGPFDFVLMDADRSTEYLEATAPKLIKGGIYITHGGNDPNEDYSLFLKGLKDFDTDFNPGGRFCISKKK